MFKKENCWTAFVVVVVAIGFCKLYLISKRKKGEKPGQTYAVHELLQWFPPDSFGLNTNECGFDKSFVVAFKYLEKYQILTQVSFVIHWNL